MVFSKEKRAAKTIEKISACIDELRHSGQMLFEQRDAVQNAISEIKDKIRRASSDEESMSFMGELEMRERFLTVLDDQCDLNKNTVSKLEELFGFLQSFMACSRFADIIKLVPIKKIVKLSRKPELIATLADLVNDVYKKCYDEYDTNMASLDVAIAVGAVYMDAHENNVAQHRAQHMAERKKRIAEIRGEIANADVQTVSEYTENNGRPNKA